MGSGTLITLEGIDGAGKSTLASGLVNALQQRDVAVTLLREPGGEPTAEAIRELLRDPSRRIAARTEALLFAAARAQLVAERLAPLRDAGAFVVLDRFVDSSLVYQGVGRGLGVETVRDINAFATADVVPDRTLLLELEPGHAASRMRSRAGATAADRIETEDAAFFARIAGAYRELAAAQPARWRVIDATQPPEAVLGAALDALSDLIDQDSAGHDGGV